MLMSDQLIRLITERTHIYNNMITNPIGSTEKPQLVKDLETHFNTNDYGCNQSSVIELVELLTGETVKSKNHIDIPVFSLIKINEFYTGRSLDIGIHLYLGYRTVIPNHFLLKEKGYQHNENLKTVISELPSYDPVTEEEMTELFSKINWDYFQEYIAYTFSRNDFYKIWKDILSTRLTIK